jgi:iron complex outermembrane receptor protein
MSSDSSGSCRVFRGDRLLLLAALVPLSVGLCAGALADEVPADLAPSAESGDALSEIVVTAQRREQRLQDVGIAVSALSGDQLQALNITNGADLARAVPSLKMNEYSSSAVVFNIRGVSQNDYGDQQEPPVAVYQDDSYSSTIVLASFPLFDLSRVEVLRGPQGTLFGRNATGGAIQFISNDPTPQFEGYGRASYASFDKARFEGAVSGPVADNLAFRLAGEITNGGNYMQAIEPGMHDLGGEHNYALRGILKWTSSDALSARLMFRYLNANHEYSGGEVTDEPACPNAQSQGVYLAPNQSCPYWGSPPGAIATGYRNDSLNPVRGGDPWKTAYTYPNYVTRRVIAGQLHLDASFGDIKLTSITDYQHANKFYSEDTDGTPDNAANYYAGLRLDQTSQELRLSGTSGANQWVLGAMGMLIDGHYFAAFDLPFLDYFPSTDFVERTKSYAFFGQDEWQIAQKVKLIGGIRYWDDKRSAGYHGVETASTGVDVTYGTAGLTYYQNGVLQPLPGLTASPADADKNFSGVTARAEVDYKPIDEVLLYVSYNRGSKSGGYTFSSATPFPGTIVPYFNGIQYKPETLDSYEVGMKTEFGRSTQLNLAAFDYRYHNYQAFAQYNVEQTIINLNAKEVGFEAELTSRPIHGLMLQLGTSALSSTVEHVPLPDGVTYANHNLPQAAHFSGSALARYELPIAQGIGSVQADTTFTSRFCFSVLCAPVEHEPGYTVLNARLGYSVGSFDIETFVTNLTNREYRVYGADNSLTAGFVYSIFAPPRMFGVNVSYKSGGTR